MGGHLGPTRLRGGSLWEWSFGLGGAPRCPPSVVPQLTARGPGAWVSRWVGKGRGGLLPPLSPNHLPTDRVLPPWPPNGSRLGWIGVDGSGWEWMGMDGNGRSSALAGWVGSWLGSGWSGVGGAAPHRAGVDIIQNTEYRQQNTEYT